MSVVSILKKVDKSNVGPGIYSTGRRKRSVARLWIKKNGSGRFVVNTVSLQDYLHSQAYVSSVTEPFLAVGENCNVYDVNVTVKGGGISGQSGAIRHALSRALLLMNEAYRVPLRREKMLTRDSREVERKKPGQSGARKKFQFSKR